MCDNRVNLYALLSQLRFTHRQKSPQGFTLIELLVVIIMIGVLAAIAWPSYLNFINRSAAQEAKLILSNLMRREQEHFMEHNEFSDFRGTLTTAGSSNYTIVIDEFNNHQTLEGAIVSGLRLRAIPQQDSLAHVMGKVWVAENDVKTVLCDSELDQPLMQATTYCPD